MKVAVIYNKSEIHESDVIHQFGMPTKEHYNPITVERVAAALEKNGHNVRIIEGNMRVVEELQRFMPRVVTGERPGMVFNMAYGIQGHSRYTHIPAMLEMLGIPYVGSNPPGHAVALDKVMTKIVFRQHNLPTPDFWVFSSMDADFSDVTYPVIVKPKMEAVSYGLKVVDNVEDLKEAVRFILEEFQQQVLVEAFIPGREFAVGLLGNGASLETLPIVEIDLEGDPDAIQTADDKLLQPRNKLCPAPLPEDKAEELRRLSRSAFNALNLCDFSRVDFRMGEDGNLHILEINSMASLGKTGSYVHAASVAGMDYHAMVNRMLDVAAERYFGQELREAALAETAESTKGPPLRVRIRSYLRSQQQTLEDELSTMVGIHSSVDNVEGVNALGKLVSSRFQRLGFSRQVYPQTEIGNVLYFSNHTNDQNDVLLIGYLDTPQDPASYIPFSDERSRLVGTGIAQPKGGLVITLAALQALRHARALRKFSCGVLLATDLSLFGRVSKGLIQEHASRSKYVVYVSPGNTDGSIVTSCVGSQSYGIDFTLIKSGDLKPGADLMGILAQKLLSWQKAPKADDGSSLQIRTLHGETRVGRAPDHAQVRILTRYNKAEEGDRIERDVVRIAEKRSTKNLRVAFRRGIKLAPVIKDAKNSEFFDRVADIAKRLEVRIGSSHREDASMLSHVPSSVAALGGFGASGGDLGTPGEYVLRDSLVDRAALLAMTIHDCARKDG